MGELRIVIRQQGENAIVQPIPSGAEKAFYKSAFVVSRTGHLRSDDLIAKGKAAVVFAEPECSAHAITTGVSKETGLDKVEVKRRCFACGCIGRQHGLKIPDAAKRGGIRRSHDAGGGRGDGVPGGGVLFAGRGLAGGEQEKTGGGNAYHIVGFGEKIGKTMPACLGNPYPEIPI